jgi:hypothetical protein
MAPQVTVQIGKFPTIPRNRVARFALLPMIERVLTAFRGHRTPKKADCLQANARRQHALFIHRLWFEIPLNKKRFSLLKGHIFNGKRASSPLPLGVLYFRYIRPPRLDGC